MSAQEKLAEAFDTFNSVRLQSPTLEKIWREGFGEEYAGEARPDAFYPQSVLDRIISVLQTQSLNKALLDIGCGHGLTGLYLAKSLQMPLIGIDISPVSIELAQKNAEAVASELKSQQPPRFSVASVDSTGLPSDSCAAAVCLDVMLYFPDKLAAIKEVARVLQRRGVFAFTTWEQHGYNPRLGAAQVEDFRPLLLEAGFEIQSYGQVEGWTELQGRVMKGLVDQEHVLTSEIGEQAAKMLAGMARSALDEASERRYVLGIAVLRINKY